MAMALLRRYGRRGSAGRFRMSGIVFCRDGVLRISERHRMMLPVLTDGRPEDMAEAAMLDAGQVMAFGMLRGGSQPSREDTEL